MQCGKRCRSMCAYSAVQEVKPEGRRVCRHHHRTTCGSENMPSLVRQGLSQDLETGCRKMAIVNFLGILFFKGELNMRSHP